MSSASARFVLSDQAIVDRYVRPQERHSDRIGHLVRRLYPRLCLPEHWHARGWPIYQWHQCRYLLSSRCVDVSCLEDVTYVAAVPVYVAELAAPSKRGRVVGAQQWAITWGIMIMFYISYGCSFLNGTAAFRVPWGLQMIPAIILGCSLFFTPESPRYVSA